MTPLGMLDDEHPNLARYVFTNLRARGVYADWDAAADEQVARLRAAEPRWGSEPAFVALVEELGAVDGFTSRWSTHPVAEKRRGAKRLLDAAESSKRSDRQHDPTIVQPCRDVRVNR